jgi:hypothetical protein
MLCLSALLAEKRAGLENFVFDWLINADRLVLLSRKSKSKTLFFESL